MNVLRPADQRQEESFTYATAETVVHDDDILVVAGSSEQVERFADRA
ncbi:hypothetical protein ABT324_22505 [Saccharopolyspora sp. NPDC000359]